MDRVLRAINGPETVRVISAVSTEAVREACRRQDLRGIEAVVIGRALIAGALLATIAKADRERVRVQFEGGGPVDRVIVDAHGDGRVRACLTARVPERHPAQLGVDLQPRPSTAAAVGARGHLVVTRDLGLARPYQGSVELRCGEIDEDLEHYLQHSEQLPSALRTAVVLDADGELVRAAGVLAQSFPGSGPARVTAIRERLAGTHLRELLVARERSVDELIGLALGGAEFRRMLEQELRFSCPCGPERARAVVSALGASDLDSLANEQPQTEVRCNFCGQATLLSSAELREIASELRRIQS